MSSLFFNDNVVETSKVPNHFFQVEPPPFYFSEPATTPKKTKGSTTQRGFPWVFWNLLYRNRGYELEGAELKKWTDQLLKKTSKGKEVIMRRCCEPAWRCDRPWNKRMGGEKLSQYIMIPQQKMSFRDFLLEFFVRFWFGEDVLLKVKWGDG